MIWYTFLVTSDEVCDVRALTITKKDNTLTKNYLNLTQMFITADVAQKERYIQNPIKYLITSFLLK